MEEAIKNKLMEEINCKAIILFGSFARKTQNSESDIDIAFLADKMLPKKNVYSIKQKLEDIVNRDVDLIDLNSNIGDGFKYEIIINGKLLYCENEIEFDLYKIKVMREYQETNEGRQMVIDRIKKGGSIYGK